MKINSINNINTKYALPSFRHTAVPYPEYENAYNYQHNSALSVIAEKISELFKPKVTAEANNIKNTIDEIYQPDLQSNPKARLLSVIA